MSTLRQMRRKIADSPWVTGSFASAVARYLAFCHRTSRWEKHGIDDMMAAVQEEQPVIFVVWHQRLLMAPFIFDVSAQPLSTLTSAARAGRMAGDIICKLGYDTIAMASYHRHIALSREVLRRYTAGHSLGIAADGPRGPARISSTVPLVWNRTTGARIYCGAFAQKGAMKLPTWDEMMLPRPYSRGVLVAREWDVKVPRKASETETEALRRSLEDHLNKVTDEADGLC